MSFRLIYPFSSVTAARLLPLRPNKSVTAARLLPLRPNKLPRKSTALTLTNFVGWGLSEILIKFYNTYCKTLTFYQRNTLTRHFTPSSLFPTLYSLIAIPYSLFPIHYSLLSIPCLWRIASYMRMPAATETLRLPIWPRMGMAASSSQAHSTSSLMPCSSLPITMATGTV